MFWRVFSIFSMSFLSFLHKNPFLEANILFISQSLLAYISPFARLGFLALSISWTSYKTWLICLTGLQMLSQKQTYLKHKEPSQVLVPNLIAICLLSFAISLSWRQSICTLALYLLWSLSIPFLYGQRQNLKNIFYKSLGRYLIGLVLLAFAVMQTSNFIFIHLLFIGFVLAVSFNMLSILESSALSVLLMFRLVSAQPVDFFIMLALCWIQICALYRGLLYVQNTASTTHYSRKLGTEINDQSVPFGANLSTSER